MAEMTVQTPMYRPQRGGVGAPSFKTRAQHAFALTLWMLLGGCISGSSLAQGSVSQPPARAPVVMVPLKPVPDGPAPTAASEAAVIELAVVVPVAINRPDAGLLLLLVPDNQNMADPQVHAWVDAASEEGVRLQPITDTQFLKLGRGAMGFAGLVLPDSLHMRATDELIAAITSYAQSGGNAMLVYDFGALTQKNGSSFYAIPKSRMSALAGVDYVLYDALRAKTSGWGPVRARASTLRELLVPPGKSIPYESLAPKLEQDPPLETAADTAPGLPNSDGVVGQSVPYLAGNPQEPGSTKGLDPQQRVEVAISRLNLSRVAPAQTAAIKAGFGSSLDLSPVRGVTEVAAGQSRSHPMESAGTAGTADEPLHVYSGYLLDSLNYPTYVTQGDFGWPTNPRQTVLADSPQFGLVAGVNPVGLGKVLFVNLPLTYLKGSTDALMMHGFLHYFTRNILNMPYLSAMPNGVAGLTFDWHLDFIEAQSPTLKLMAMNVFNDPTMLFSVEMTAGPDTNAVGDQLGWNLPANYTAQEILRTFDKFGHSVGSHGGWNHNYVSARITETNQLETSGGACVNGVTQIDNFEQCYVLNRQAVDGAIDHASRGYSSPNGNNPPWAMTWLEDRGVVAAYFAGHTGLGVTRHYRDGKRLNPKMWVFPVTPAGTYATFEEWQLYDVPKSEISQWYHDLIDFNIAQNTSRMVYAHPPGAYLWQDVLLDMLAYAKAQQQAGKLNWYTMTRLADFMTTRLDVQWSQITDASGMTRFDASHPSSLSEMAWRLPKSKYASAPLVVSGNAAVEANDAKYWLVKAGPGRRLVFTAKPNQR